MKKGKLDWILFALVVVFGGVIIYIQPPGKSYQFIPLALYFAFDISRGVVKMIKKNKEKG